MNRRYILSLLAGVAVTGVSPTAMAQSDRSRKPTEDRAKPDDVPP